MTTFLIAVALAGDGPVRCTAKWTGPVEKCAVRGDLEVQATAPSEKAADKAARKQLAEVMALSEDAVRARVTTIGDTEFDKCEASLSTAYVNCFPEPQLAGPKLCFVELKDPDCWTGDVLNLEEEGWRALDAGRKLMCAAVDKRLVEQNYSDVTARRAECKARCEALTTVKCPG